MPFTYSCFISYRHGQRKLAERIVNDLYEALSNELELFLDEKVYLDRERLKGGDFYNEALATALCQSVCMIVIFTPTYFHQSHLFCLREYKAMEKLEEARLKLLGLPADQQHGLIIPIIFRGEDFLPAEIKAKRHYYNFEEFLLSDVAMSHHPNYAIKIREIAEYIAARAKAFSAVSDDVCSTCTNFALPSEDEVKPWLQNATVAKVQFVLREGGQ